MTMIAQPERPTQFPLRVPVVATFGNSAIRAEVLGSTPNVMLLQGLGQVDLPTLGTPVRLRVDWDRQLLSGRLAAHGVGSRFLVTLGERPIRRTRRFPVDLPATIRSPHLYGSENARITDLSSSGARVSGVALPVGSELELSFTAPGQKALTSVHGFVIRGIDAAPRQNPSIGVAFRLASIALDLSGV